MSSLHGGGDGVHSYNFGGVGEITTRAEVTFRDPDRLD